MNKSARRPFLFAVPLLVAFATSMLMAGCITRTRQYGFEVKKGSTIEEKIENAKAAVTEDRLSRLKAELRQMNPALTDSHLERLGIRWLDRWAITASGGKSDRSVTVVVIMEEGAGIDATDVVERAARLLDAEINGPGNSSIDDSPK